MVRRKAPPAPKKTRARKDSSSSSDSKTSKTTQGSKASKSGTDGDSGTSGVQPIVSISQTEQLFAAQADLDRAEADLNSIELETEITAGDIASRKKDVEEKRAKYTSLQEKFGDSIYLKKKQQELDAEAAATQVMEGDLNDLEQEKQVRCASASP